MIVYLDTGFFIDYFSKRSMVALQLRTKSRRGRGLSRIYQHSEQVIRKSNSHELKTSVISALEYSDNTYKALKKFSRGLTDIRIDNVMKTKSETTIFHRRCQKDGISIVPLDTETLRLAIRNPEYDEFAIMDAIHLQTARSIKANLIISGDAHFLKHDKKFDNIRILDTNGALKLL